MTYSVVSTYRGPNTQYNFISHVESDNPQRAKLIGKFNAAHGAGCEMADEHLYCVAVFEGTLDPVE